MFYPYFLLQIIQFGLFQFFFVASTIRQGFLTFFSNYCMIFNYFRSGVYNRNGTSR
jgi:hypothetical protein